MPMKYYKLLDLLNRRGMMKTDLAPVISRPTIAKIFSGQNVNTDVLCAICAYLKCDISDIVEYQYDESEMKKQAMGIKPRKQDESENKSESISDVISDAE